MSRLLACYDPRLSQEEIARILGVRPQRIEEILGKIRSMPSRETLPQHIRDITALGLKTLIVYAKPLEKIPSTLRELEAAVPVARYFYSYRTVASMKPGGVYTYLLPPRLEEEILEAVLEGLEEVTWYDIGRTVPIKPPCHAIAHMLPPERLEATTRALEQELAKRIMASTRIIEYGIAELLVYAILDLNPLATRRELLDPSPVIAERLETPAEKLRLRKKKVMTAYERLSAAGLVGRVLLHGMVWGGVKPSTLFIETDQGCAARLYSLASTSLASANVFIGENSAATIAAMPDQYFSILKKLFLDECETFATYPVADGVGTTLPIEMYNPKTGWSLEPQPLIRILEGLGLLQRT